MDGINIYSLSEKNIETLDTLFEQIKNKYNKGEENELLLKFINYIKNSNISINKKGNGTLDFLEVGYIKPLNERFNGDMKLIKQSQKEYAPVRIRFEKTFVNGTKFLYGALNMNNIGLVKNWGPYTFIFEDKTLEGYEEKTLLKHNTLRKTSPNTFYYFEQSEVDLIKLETDLCPLKYKEKLAVIKHQEDFINFEEYEWSSKVCDDTLNKPEYIEFITSNKIELDHVTSVTFPLEESMKFNDSILDLLRSEEDDYSDITIFNKVRKILLEKSINFQII